MKLRSVVRAFVLAGFAYACAARADAGSAVFGGGPFYSGGQAVMDTLRGSGFNNARKASNRVSGVRRNQHLGCRSGLAVRHRRSILCDEFRDWFQPLLSAREDFWSSGRSHPQHS